MTGVPSSLRALFSCFGCEPRAGEGRNRTATSYGGLLKQVLDFFFVAVFLLFQGLTESYSKQFSGYPNSLACLSAKEEKIFSSPAF